MNHFLALGAPVYARGYLKKYAVMLGLAPDVVVSRYEGLTDTPVEPTPAPTGTAPPPRATWPKYVVWAVLVAVVVGLVIVVLEFVVPVARRMMATRGDAPVVVAPVSAPRSEAQSPVQTAAAPAQSTPASETPANETIAATPIVEPAAAPSNPVPEPAPVASASEPVRLRIEFNEPSWAEVYDATGQRLLYDVGQPDRPRVVSGAAPLNGTCVRSTLPSIFSNSAARCDVVPVLGDTK